MANVLCVCTHNRTRSVMAAALLRRHLAERSLTTTVTTAGLASDGQPPISRAVKEMAARNLDISGHRSAVVSADDVSRADLILTAEHDHVIELSGRWPDAFRRTFTLPEFVDRAAAVGPLDGRAWSAWLDEVGADRTEALGYLADRSIPEVRDPTGERPAVWRGVVGQLDELTASIAQLLAG